MIPRLLELRKTIMEDIDKSLGRGECILCDCEDENDPPCLFCRIIELWGKFIEHEDN